MSPVKYKYLKCVPKYSTAPDPWEPKGCRFIVW